MRRHVSILLIGSTLFMLLLASMMVVGEQDEDIPHNEVRNWALKFGVDLWEFGRQFTKMNDIKNKYKDFDGEVTRKDGIILLRELAGEVKNFMDFKMNAVMRIMDSAEQAALSESDLENRGGQAQSLDKRFHEPRHFSEFSIDGKSLGVLKPMRRFDKLAVNLSLSSILVPSGVELNDPDVQSSIAWSSHLDPLFSNNLERDSALSWQYFGSSLGFLRRYPGTTLSPNPAGGNSGGISGNNNGDKDSSRHIHDFRTEDWFVQAASSPKDIMILLDSSGSMSGTSFELAIKTIAALLDTLSDDDFVNVIVFSDTTRSAVPCFTDKMVRATPDNKKEILSAVKAVKCENVANFTAGFEHAFELLRRYNTTGQGAQCNQAIMLITDGLSETHNDIIKHYNWPHMPVRIFTYLIRGDSGSRENMHLIACSNKGYYVQINSEEDAKRRVIEYALVMARPMVLYQADHPIHWSPVFSGGKTTNLGTEKRRLVTTVSTPVYDRRNHSVRVANLLGVVGTDVPIEDIKKMVPQHKLGVNGYSFIVDNNGRVLYHPDLRALGDGSEYLDMLKPKYNSIDLTEVELPEVDSNNINNMNIANSRDDEDTNMLLDMRHEMVLQKEGEMEFSVLTHMDDMRRATLRTQRYFYGPIEGTPFTLAITLPDKYGMHELNSQEEIRHSQQNGINVTSYLKGDNWRVHPDWVYCEYNSLHEIGAGGSGSIGGGFNTAPGGASKENVGTSGEQLGASGGGGGGVGSGGGFNAGYRETTFDTPEQLIVHFLTRAGQPGWKWMSLRPRSPQPHHGHGGIPVGKHAQYTMNSQQGSKKSEPYFCDRPLMQTLVRDALVTNGMDQEMPAHPTRKEDKQQGYQMFGVKLSFVATRSGLLRWVDHIQHSKDSQEPHFGDTHIRAIDSSWYKRAVDQHTVEPESFVFSVPFDSGYSTKTNTTLVTAAHAIFIEHKGHKAPAAVVGLQFQHDSLARHFKNITSACTGSSGACRKTCASDELDCYILDNNGFVIISENNEHTGRFFGQIDGTIMDSLVQDRIYRRIGLMNYQGVCSDQNSPYSAAHQSKLQLHTVSWLFKWIATFATTWISLIPQPVACWATYDSGLSQPGNDDFDDDIAYSEDYDEEIQSTFDNDPHIDEIFTTEKQETVTYPPKLPQQPAIGPRVLPDPYHSRPCDLKTDLYVLQPERLNSSTPLKGKLTNCHSSGCERPFSVQKIPHSNLILLVVDTLCPCGSKQLDIEAQEVPGGTGACGVRRLVKELLPRKRPLKCINYHPEEIEIQQCGAANQLHKSTRTLHVFVVSILLSIVICTATSFTDCVWPIQCT